jgi:hypothetical protein
MKRNGIVFALLNIVKGEVAPFQALRPVYSLPNAIPNHTYSAFVKRVFKRA